MPAVSVSQASVRINRLDESEIDLLFDFPSGEGQSRNFGLGKMNMWMGQAGSAWVRCSGDSKKTTFVVLETQPSPEKTSLSSNI